MNKLVFPKLQPDQIEVRVGQCFQKGYTLLLYQDARTAANLLDRVVGPFNWQKRYYELKGNIYCSIGINVHYNDETKEPLWVWKDDCGAESNTEKEKGEASDAMKRAFTQWGGARELYYSGFIWVNGGTQERPNGGYELDKENKNRKFFVEEIEWQDGEFEPTCKKLVIKDIRTKEVVYSYGSDKKAPKSTENQPKNKGYFEPKDFKVGDTFLNNEKGSITEEQIKMIDTYVSGLTIVSHDNFFKRLDAVYGVGTINLLSEQQAQEIIDKIGGKK